MNACRKFTSSFLILLVVLFSFSSFSSVKKIPFPPSRPGLPMVIDIWSNRCTIQYKASLSDGGAPIQRYIIEKRKVDGKWEYAGSTKSLTYTIGNLIRNEMYQFQVFAENEAGLSEPSYATDFITIRDPFR